MAAPARSVTPFERSVPSLGRRRFAAAATATVAGTLVMVGTGAVASQSAQPPVPMATRLQHTRVLSYPADQVWPTAIRYLRVDRAYEVVDRDRDAGFILFDFPLEHRPETPGRGSLELVATVDAAGRAAVRLVVSTDAGPTHLPHAIAEGLADKLKQERGQPAPPPSPTPPPEPAPPLGPWADPPIVDAHRGSMPNPDGA